ncbi:uncharacterized protein DUF3710 [Kocuria rhizophila]|uniref:DUF3710 domain-containing protein n=1 Tax=Kocuria rhizophila (strain ATCC 9341 / DSM 348 / NBRC 103217 / DC2201) TaxID=378753 RepID=B2GJ64_KOCRD|nr:MULTISPECIES: DUF3710 domain-containing protein [Kocuria]ASE10369.1 DUF3710 domain-containing protein [Kocuria rhizophila]BAG29769.1 hypothetical protein KRH_14220 [Kocuria rhizophila DC2201]VEH74955.1 Protein of uncharacterised function (DUF3710) [Kocuria rhizophila]
MFGRRKRTRAEAADTAQQTGATAASAEDGEATEPRGDVDRAEDPRANGPWDESEFTGERGEYLDLGALLVKPMADVTVRVEVDQATQVPRAVNLDFRDGSVQLQAFTAPKSSGLWDEVRAELVAGLRRDGAQPTIAQGPLGAQVDVRIPGTTPDGQQGFRLARFVGIDGPRWFLRAVFTGGAALPGTTAEVLDDAVRALVVVRGQDPHPPRDLLTLSMPQDATVTPAHGGPEHEGSDATAGDRAASGPAVQPPRRGPEITEIG